MNDERLLILHMLRDGKIGVGEAERLLAALELGKSEPKSGADEPTASRNEQADRDPWAELGDVWEKFGSEMEKFWKEFGETMNENLGQKWARKMEHWAENFGESLKHMSRDWTVIAGEAARQFFDSMGVDADVVIDFDHRGIEVRESCSWEQEAGPIGKVQVQNRRGTVQIEGWDDPRIVIEAEKIVKAETREKGQQVLAALSLLPLITDDTLKISTFNDQPQGSRVLWKLNVKAPRSCQVDIQQLKGPMSVSGFFADIADVGQSGDVSLNEINGGMRVQLSKGDLAASECRGNASFQLAKGDIALTKVSGSSSINLMKGDLSINDSDGRLKVRGAMGDASVRNHTGDLDIVLAKGDLDLMTEHATSIEITGNYGDQQVHFTPLPGGVYSFVAHHGDVSLSLTGESHANFDVQVIRGSLESNLFKVPTSGSPLHVARTVGRGDSSVRVSVVKGDLEILGAVPTRQDSETESDGPSPIDEDRPQPPEPPLSSADPLSPAPPEPPQPPEPPVNS